MARLSVVLAVVLLVGLIVLGTVQTFITVPESALAGASVLDVREQRDINLCMRDCMHGCVTEVEDNKPCTQFCEGECKI